MKQRRSFLPLTFFLLVFMLGCSSNTPTGSGGPFSGEVVQAAWCDVLPTPCCDQCAGSPSLVLAITNVDKNSTGDGTLTIEIAGDIDEDSDETLAVSVEGLSLGVLFNGDPDDDEFNVPGDTTTDCTLTTAVATIPASSLSGIVADGEVVVTLTPRQSNNDIEDAGCGDTGTSLDETITITLDYSS